MTEAEFDTLKSLATLRSEAEAQSVVNILAEHGIDARAVGGFTSQFIAESPGKVDVMVRGDMLDEARELLNEIKATASESELVNYPTETLDANTDQGPPKHWSLLRVTLAGMGGMLLNWAAGNTGFQSMAISFVAFAGLLALVQWHASKNQTDVDSRLK